MARISKPGLDYFPLDVNFLQDRKVRRISCRHHAAGIAALTSLLCLIYKEKGYYVLWNKDTLFDIAQEACCEEEEMQAIIDDCLSVGLFDTYIYKEYGVLTSQAIQEQYHKIIIDSRRKYKLPLENFWMIKEEKEANDNEEETKETKERKETKETKGKTEDRRMNPQQIRANSQQIRANLQQIRANPQQQCHKQNKKRIQILKVNRKWRGKMKANRKPKKTKRQRGKENEKGEREAARSAKRRFSGFACCCKGFVFRGFVRRGLRSYTTTKYGSYRHPERTDRQSHFRPCPTKRTGRNQRHAMENPQSRIPPYPAQKERTGRLHPLGTQSPGRI